jgi:capsular exopolysaccharide synthesis family protein
MERAQQLRILWNYKWWLLAFAITAALVAYLISNSRDPVYSASALAQIVSSRQAAGEQLSEDELLSLSNVYVELASTDTVSRIAHRDPSVRGQDAEFDSSVSVEPQQRVGVLSFTAETGDPDTSADWANAYATAFVEYTDRLQSDQRDRALDRIQARIDQIQADLEERGVSANDPSVAGLTAELEALQSSAAAETAAPGDTVRVIEQAVPDSNPISPKPWRDALLALLGALIIGAIAAYIREALVDRFSSPEEASAELGVPILGEIPKASADVPVLEAFRRLRTAVVVALESASAGVAAEHGRTVLVTGAEPGSGKSFVSSNLARALAAEGWKVVAVDGDLRRPTLHEQFDVPREPGLGDLLIGGGLEQYPERVAFQVSSSATEPGGRGELRALTSGPYIEDSVERFSSQRMADVVERLKELNDFVIIDSPPALAVVDPVVLARYSDGVVIVIDSRKTKRRDARRAVQTMRAIGTPVLGMVYNRSEAPVGGYYSYDALGSGLEGRRGGRMRGAAR